LRLYWMRIRTACVCRLEKEEVSIPILTQKAYLQISRIPRILQGREREKVRTFYVHIRKKKKVRHPSSPLGYPGREKGSGSATSWMGRKKRKKHSTLRSRRGRIKHIARPAKKRKKRRKKVRDLRSAAKENLYLDPTGEKGRSDPGKRRVQKE